VSAESSDVAYARLSGDTKLLWHYTTWSGLEGIVRNNAIWASHIAYLNDSREYVHGMDLLWSVFERLEYFKVFPTMHKSLLPDMYTTSFSAKFDDLGQWRAYSGSAGGIAVGFDREALNEVAKGFGAQLLQCLYLSKEEMSENTIDELRSEIDTLNKLRAAMEDPDADQKRAGRAFQMRAGETAMYFMPALAARLKHKGFEEENEYRVTIKNRYIQANPLRRAFHVKGSLVVPHVIVPLSPKDDAERKKNPIRGILVGPSAHKDLIRHSVEALLRDAWPTGTLDVSMSELPFRNW
jgi:hypothetical protein